MKARVVVRLKQDVLDPQGQTIQRSLQKMGHTGVAGVRQGKYFELTLEGVEDPEEARRTVERVAAEVLSNPIIEAFEIEDIS